VAVPPPEFLGLLLLPPPQPETLNAPIVTTSARSGAKRRRRFGIIHRKMPASETAVPEYQGFREVSGLCRLAVVVLCAAMMVSVVVAGVPAETFTEDEEKAMFAAMDESAETVKVTGPLKLLAEVTVKGIPAAVAPDATVVELVHGVRAKSGFVEETKSATRLPFELM
jgi:hypothetical protein